MSIKLTYALIGALSLTMGLMPVAFADPPARTVNYLGSGTVTCPDGTTRPAYLQLQATPTGGTVTGTWLIGTNAILDTSAVGTVDNGKITPNHFALTGIETFTGVCFDENTPVTVDISGNCNTGDAKFSDAYGITGSFSKSGAFIGCS